MTHVLGAFWAFLRTGMGIMLQYRGEILLWAIWGLVNPAVLYAVWSSAAQTSETGLVAGFGRSDFAAYFFVMMIVGHITTAWDTYELGYYIRSGRMSAKLLRPILPMWESLATNWSYKITTLAFVVPMWCLFAWIVRPTFHTNGWQLALGSLAILLASALNFVIGYVVALIAFWTPKLDAIGELYFGIGMFFGGRFAPLDALPHPMHAIANAMPFRYIFGFPSELTMGRITDVRTALAGIAWQLIWLAAGIVAFRLSWSAAVKRYTAVSG